MNAPSVWVTRPEPGNRRTARALHEVGYSVVDLPVLEIIPVLPEDFRPTAWPKWLILVSANAVRGLEAMKEAGRLPVPEGRSAVRVAAVGRRTAEEARARGWNVELVPGTENAEGLAAELAGQDMNGESVWIPSGNREGSARRNLPERLGSLGARVEIFSVYETVERELNPSELRRLDTADPGAIVLHSPSSAEAVYAGDVSDAVRRWHGVPALCIGKATSLRCRDLGAIQILECESPSDRGILRVLSSIASLRPERNSS